MGAVLVLFLLGRAGPLCFWEREGSWCVAPEMGCNFSAQVPDAQERSFAAQTNLQGENVAYFAKVKSRGSKIELSAGNKRNMRILAALDSELLTELENKTIAILSTAWLRTRSNSEPLPPRPLIPYGSQGCRIGSYKT